MALPHNPHTLEVISLHLTAPHLHTVAVSFNLWCSHMFTPYFDMSNIGYYNVQSRRVHFCPQNWPSPCPSCSNCPCPFSIPFWLQKGDVEARFRTQDLAIPSSVPYPCCHGSFCWHELLTSVWCYFTPWDLPKLFQSPRRPCSFVVNQHVSPLSRVTWSSHDSSSSPLLFQDGCHHSTEPGAACQC